MAPRHTSSSAPAQLERPSERAIAFAISVVRSKPDGLSVREYIHLLRQHIARGHRQAALSSTHHHLDRSSYWRSECERVKSALQIAQGETVDLQREIDQLKAKLETAKSATAPVRKRKKVDEDVILVPRSPKRVRKDVSPSRAAENSRETEGEFDFSGVGDVGNEFMRALYQTHVALKSRNRAEADVLAHHLNCAAKALPKVVHQLIERSLSSTTVDLAQVKTTLTASNRAVLSLIVGVNRLSHAADGGDVQGSVVYAYIQMFSNLLSIIEDVSAYELQLATTASFSKTSALRKKEVKSRQPKTTNLKDNATLNAVTAFLCSIIALLNANSEVHQSLFEGFAYCVLNKLGDRLYTTTFGRARGLTIEDEIAASIVPDEMEDTSAPSTEAPTEREIQIRQATIEAPYLVHLLTRIMNAAPLHLGPTISAKTGRARQLNSKGSMKGALAVAAKDRLQRTLVNCVFGMEGVDEDHPLMECLKAPAPMGPELAVPKIKEADVQEWFGEEVWRVLGWEILAKE